MSKSGKKRDRRERSQPAILDQQFHTKQKKGEKSAIKPKTDNQAKYLNAIRTSTLTFGIGPAGTGKTFIAACEAADMLRDGAIDKIIITRPAVEAGESLGFLPGELEEKFDPYFAPVKAILEQRLGTGHLEYFIRSGQVEAKPLAHMRGVTFENAFVLLDEAQNTTPKQMEMFLTRIGNHTKVVVDGDIRQQDIPGKSGLQDAMYRFAGRRWCRMIEFDMEDVVRSGIAKEIVLAYNGVEDASLSELPAFLKDEEH